MPRHARSLVTVLAATSLAIGGLVLAPSALAAIPAGDSGATLRSQCTLLGTSGDDRLVGTSGDDVICGMGGDDVLIGLGGDDVLWGGPGSDRLEGGVGDDQLFGGSGKDDLDGGPGDDSVGSSVGQTGSIRVSLDNRTGQIMTVNWGGGNDCTSAITASPLTIDSDSGADFSFSWDSATFVWEHCATSTASAHLTVLAKGGDGDIWLIATGRGQSDYQTITCSGSIRCDIIPVPNRGSYHLVVKPKA